LALRIPATANLVSGEPPVAKRDLEPGAYKVKSPSNAVPYALYFLHGQIKLLSTTV